MKYLGVLDIMRESRGRLMEGWGKVEALHYKDENAASAVTELDTEIEDTVSKKVLSKFPDIGFVGEERGGDRAGRFWLMDPIDGTAHYIRGTTLCTSMLALVENDIVTFSAIYDFVNDHMYFAERGKGAFMNDSRVSVGERTLRDAYIGFETHLDDPVGIDNFSRLSMRTTIVRTITAGWELAMVASGKLDGRICLNPYGKDYDFAPGTLLVAEAGGMVTNMGKQSYDYRNLNFIATNKRIHSELTEGKTALYPVS